MAKRLTDTNKWDKGWFRKLSPTMKSVWQFLCDKCDHAGVWDIDHDAFKYFVGEDVSIETVLKTFGDRIELRGDKLYLTTFNSFQYGDLNPNNRVHKSVLLRLEKLDPSLTLKRPLEGCKDKDKDKVKVKDKDPVFNSSQNFESRFNPEYQTLKDFFNDNKLGNLGYLIPNILTRFGNLESFDNWYQGLVNSKTFPKDQDFALQSRYITTSLKRELGLIPSEAANA